MDNDVPKTRRAQPTDRWARPVGSRWAVLIGVSAYHDKRLDLRFAAKDATDLADLIRTPTGGAFPEENVLLLVDEQATTREVTRALRSFLTRPAPEDLVMIYFACHGGPDGRRPNGPLYLLTHDTEPGDIAGTAVPMDEIQGALRDSLLSERVVVIADTCHSGDLGGARRRSIASAEATNRYLGRLAESKAGVALLTSCEAAESSQEDERWGGGHGVFTWHLLEGMRGAADGFGGERDGIVGVGELFEYVRDRVRADTGDEQHPNAGAAAYDRDLPMAATGDLDVQRHLALARHLVDLGWLTDDPAAFACAVRETQVAEELAALSGKRLRAGAVLRAEALLATDRAKQAAAALGSGRVADDEPQADLVRGVALAESGHTEEAAAALGRFAAEHSDDVEARWAGDYAAAIGLGGAARRHALLIGAGTFELEGIALPGASNDARALADLLVHRAGFTVPGVRVLVDGAATRAGLLQAFEYLAEEAGPHDTIVISFSGHGGGLAPDGGPFLVTHDTNNNEVRGVSGTELAALLGRIPGGARLLILDGGPGRAFLERMSTQGDWVILKPTGRSVDVNIDGTPHGAFTKALLESWPEDPYVRCGYLATHASQWLREHGFEHGGEVGLVRTDPDQSPGLVHLLGDPLAPAVAPRFPGARLWRLARDRSASEVAGREIAARAGGLTAYGHSFWALARRDLRAGAPLAALRSLDEARRLLGTEIPLLEVDRVRALLALGGTDDAARSLAECAALPQTPPDVLVPAVTAVAAVGTRRARALVVGIDAYAVKSVTRPSGARADAESFAATLSRSGIVETEDVVLLLDTAATRERILAEFEALARHGAEDLAVFHFAGAGSWAPHGGPTILSVDARTTPAGSGPIPDIALADLATMSAASDNLVAVIDAGSPHLPAPGTGRGPHQPEAGSRTTLPPGDGPSGLRQTSAGDDPVLGAVTLVPAVPPRARDRTLERAASRSGEVRGRLTLGLEQALTQAQGARHPQEPLSYLGAVGAGRLRGRATVSGAAASEPLLRHRTALASADAALRELELRPARSCLVLADTLVTEAETRNESPPRAHLEAGLALDALGDHAAAVPRLRAARNLSDEGSGSTGRRPTTDPDAWEWHRWASHHLGRILYEQEGDLNEAVAALRAAYARGPREPRTSFHLANAVYTLVQRESLREVEAHFRRYLDLGAPLGQVDRVEEILDYIEEA